MLADMLSRLIDIDPNLKQQPKLKDPEFGKYCFETLPKARGYTHHQKIVGRIMTCVKYKSHMTMMKIQYFLLNYHWMMENSFPCKSRTQKFKNYETK